LRLKTIENAIRMTSGGDKFTLNHLNLLEISSNSQMLANSVLFLLFREEKRRGNPEKYPQKKQKPKWETKATKNPEKYLRNSENP